MPADAPPPGRAPEWLAGATVVITLLVLSDLLVLTRGLHGALWSELLLVLCPALLLGWSGRASLRATFRLCRPGTAALAAALLLAPAAYVLLTGVVQAELKLSALPEEVRRAFRLLESQAHERPLLALAALVLVPAVAEEALFRGVLLSWLLQSRPAALSVGLQALLFALFHRSPWRFLPMFLFGLALGALTVRSGALLPAVLAHAGYNYLVLHAPGWLDRVSGDWQGLATALMAASLALSLAGYRSRPRAADDGFT